MKKTMLFLLLFTLTLSLSACSSSDYSEATKSLQNKNYEKALAMFQTLGDYRDSADLALECKYQIALQFIEDGEYERALFRLNDIPTYKDSSAQIEFANNMLIYSKAWEKHDAQDYKAAYNLFMQIQGFRDVDIILSRFSVSQVLSSETYVLYDNLGNESRTAIKYTYDKNGRLLSAEGSNSDRLAHYSKQIYSFAHQPYTVSGASTEIYEYTNDGNLCQITGKSGRTIFYVVKYHYDPNGRIDYEEIVTNVDAGKSFYIYNNNGQVESIRFDRDTSPILFFVYDSSGKVSRLESTALGNMFTMEYVYDSELLIARKVSIRGKDYLTEHYSYNEDGTLRTVEYTYENSNNGRIRIEYHYSEHITYKES